MKKIFSALITATFLLSFFSACNSGGSGEAYTIKMRLKPGDTFSQDVKMNMSTSMTMMGQSMNMKMDMDMGSKFDVVSGDSTNKELKMTYTKAHMKMDMGMKGVSMPDSALNKVNNNLIGKTVTIKLSPTNEITDVIGVQEALTDSAMDPKTREMMEKMFSKEQFNNLYGLMFSMYPSKPVRVGDTWDAETKTNIAGIDMKIKIKYKLASVKDGLANIDVDGVIDGKGSMSQTGVNLEMDMKGTQKGTLTIKMEDGYLQSGNYKMDVKADMEVMGQKVPMTVKGDYTITGNK